MIRYNSLFSFSTYQSLASHLLFLKNFRKKQKRKHEYLTHQCITWMTEAVRSQLNLDNYRVYYTIPAALEGYLTSKRRVTGLLTAKQLCRCKWCILYYFQNNTYGYKTNRKSSSCRHILLLCHLVTHRTQQANYTLVICEYINLWATTETVCISSELLKTKTSLENHSKDFNHFHQIWGGFSLLTSPNSISQCMQDTKFRFAFTIQTFQ